MSSGTTDENFLLVRIVAGRHCGPPVHGTLRAPSGNPMAAPAHLVFAAAATPAVLSRGSILHQKPWLERISLKKNSVLYVIFCWFPQLIRAQGKEC